MTTETIKPETAETKPETKITMTPAQALVTLSVWAADYKAGIIRQDRVEAVITALVDALNLPKDERHKVLVDAMRYWIAE